MLPLFFKIILLCTIFPAIILVSVLKTILMNEQAPKYKDIYQDLNMTLLLFLPRQILANYVILCKMQKTFF